MHELLPDKSNLVIPIQKKTSYNQVIKRYLAHFAKILFWIDPIRNGLQSLNVAWKLGVSCAVSSGSCTQL